MRVVIVDDQVLLREGLARLFDDGGHEVVATLGDAEGLPSAVSTHVVARLLAPSGNADQLAALTERERTVLQMMAQGLTNTGIAKRLYLSERTVEAHVRHVLGKLELPEGEDDHRRVLAVLAHLSARHSRSEA